MYFNGITKSYMLRLGVHVAIPVPVAVQFAQSQVERREAWFTALATEQHNFTVGLISLQLVPCLSRVGIFHVDFLYVGVNIIAQSDIECFQVFFQLLHGRCSNNGGCH